MKTSEIVLQGFILLIIAGIFGTIALRMYPATEQVAHATGIVKEKVPIISPLAADFSVFDSAVGNTHTAKISPKEIAFPTLALTLPVVAGSIIANEWTLDENNVSWLATSAEPGVGNVIMYAHNREGLFGDLEKLQIGDQIDVMHDGKTHTYAVFDSHKVLPTDVEAILSVSDQLTLYTCDGAFDQKRLVVIAKRVDLL
ncbi:sortase [Candidatus Microgenomates bacterium]|nr:MAG: sortase [Candidatus Microgenomates bacterium]